ncbi:fumarylacetoacetate hydrolase family protein [Pedobacter sp. ASV28]|uniref:fumarylacetoacetate hydrolase family protein n=1 Tax=Pedobacter sp. ASV28 TaxID=2795123 RepID=UPI0018EB5B7A|nr:fumarylacetoacetate hydrolase family protein [Pedobacter sp. ASV28]
MKLIRFGPYGKERPGIILNDEYYDVSAHVQDYNEAFFENGGLNLLEKVILRDDLPKISKTQRLGSPLARPSKLVCVGLNYKDHAAETNSPLPKEPILFFKSTSAIVGPNDELVLPKDSSKTDWEVELAVVIGKRAAYVTVEEAQEYIAGYVLLNDYSERAFQLERNGQWVKGKSCDTFAPMGPFMATKDEIKDVQQLRLWLSVNGKILQDGNTHNMIFDVAFLVSYISQFMTLLPGDVITTGTPAGVGQGQRPEPWFLKPGDVVAYGIDGLGKAQQIAKAYSR